MSGSDLVAPDLAGTPREPMSADEISKIEMIKARMIQP